MLMNEENQKAEPLQIDNNIKEDRQICVGIGLNVIL